MSKDPKDKVEIKKAVDFMDEVICGSFGIEQFPPGAVTDPELEFLFDELLQFYPENEFIENVYDWWGEKGFITEAQYEALQRMHNEHTGREY